MTPKPLPYKIWKMIVTPAMFIAWVMFVAVYPDEYWTFTLCGALPVAVVDTVWEVLNFRAYRKKLAKEEPPEDSPSEEPKAQ